MHNMQDLIGIHTTFSASPLFQIQVPNYEFVLGVAVGGLRSQKKKSIRLNVAPKLEEDKPGGNVTITGNENKGYIGIMDSELPDAPRIYPEFFTTKPIE